MPATPPPPGADLWHPGTRALHEGIDAHIRRLGVPVLHPDSMTILYDLIGAEPMVAWQEGKARHAFLQETCWSELPTVYARYGTDAARRLLVAIRALYGAGAAVVTDCGAQAVALAVDAVLQPGDHAILGRQIYGKSRTYLEWAASRLGCEITVVDHVDAPTLREHVRDTTRLVLTETYSNPLTRALDPEAVSDAVESLRAERAPELTVVIDDTIATPWGLKQPLLSHAGLHVVVGAGTKALGGQDRDTLGYIVSQDIPLMNRVMDLQAMRGGTVSWRAAEVIADDLDEACRLHARRCASAEPIAKTLASHPDVEAVFHPSRPDHPDAEIIARAYARPGSLISFRVRDLDEAATLHLCNVLAMTIVIRYGLSFDGLATKVNHHQSVSEFFTPAPRLRKQGIDRLVRLSVGVEDTEDIIAALQWGLDHHRAISPEEVRRWQTHRRADLGLPAV
ncbi:MAG: PLP-dependent transferase [Alphaproteobacteria bacterium]|nr:PLP-dependent transferase [Alphaproteobacteria bacterium]